MLFELGPDTVTTSNNWIIQIQQSLDRFNAGAKGNTTAKWHGSYITTDNLVDGTWKHHIYTYDGNAATSLETAYVNGSVNGSQSGNVADTQGGFGNYQLNMGVRNGGADRLMSGSLFDVMIFNKVLNSAESNSLYLNRTNPGGLIHHWRCKEGNGTVIEDEIGGYNFTFTSGSWSTDRPL